MSIITFTLYYAHSKVIHETVQCIYQNEYLSCIHAPQSVLISDAMKTQDSCMQSNVFLYHKLDTAVTCTRDVLVVHNY